MPFELPSIPKHVVINSSLIAAILLSSVIAVIIAWQFLPLFMETPEETGQASLALDLNYQQDLTIGMTWEINGTASNKGNETLTNVLIKLHSDGNVDGDQKTIDSIEPNTEVFFELKPKVKTSSSKGEFTTLLSVRIPDTVPAEYALAVTISEPEETTN